MEKTRKKTTRLPPAGNKVPQSAIEEMLAGVDELTKRAAGRRGRVTSMADLLNTLGALVRLEDPMLAGEFYELGVKMMALKDSAAVGEGSTDLLVLKTRMRDLVEHFGYRQTIRRSQDPSDAVALILEEMGDADPTTLSRILAVSSRTLRNWRARVPRRPQNTARLTLVARILADLHLPSADARARWFTRPRTQLAGLSPIELIDRDGPDAAEEPLTRLARGQGAQLAS